MSKIVTTLTLIISLLVAPVAHASGMACDEESGKNISKVESKANSFKADKNNKSEKSDHCCCSHNVYDHVVLETPKFLVTHTKIAMATKDDIVSYLSYGPPLKPPSHA